VDDWQSRLPDLLDTVDAARVANRWDTIGALFDDYFFALSLSAPEAVERVWAEAPAAWLEAHPRYLMAAAISVAGRKPFPVIDVPAMRAFAAWVEGQESPATRDVLGVKIAEVRRHLASGRFGLASAVADEIQDIIRDADDHDGFDDVLPSVFIRLGMVRLLNGHVNQAISSFSEAWRWSSIASPHPFAPFAAAHCALAHALAGDYVHARAWRQRSVEMHAGGPGTMAFRLASAAKLADALIAIGAVDRSEARRAVDDLEVGVEGGELWWVGVHARSRVALYWGDRQAAIRELETELHAFPSLTSTASLAGVILRADLADLHQAEGQLDRAGLVLAPLNVGAPHPAAVSTLARQLILVDDAGGALNLLDTAMSPPLRTTQAPARWEVLRANLAHLMSAADERAAITRAARRLELTGAHDASADADPDIRSAVLGDLNLPDLPFAPFVREPVNLTPRERQILELLADHTSVKELAGVLFISHNTAKSHLGRLYRKLNVENRDQALRAARRLG
jgi:DNA-binding CsgD family transcriptional regulator